MFHYTYITRAKDGRYYIGVRSCECNPKEDPYMGSHKDNTYSPNRKRILSLFDSREKALEHEIYLHELRDVAISPRYANRAKQTSKGFDVQGVPKSFSEEHKAKLSQCMKGRKLTKEHKEKIRRAAEGRSFSDETKRKMRAARLGKKHSQETRKKMKEAHKKRLDTAKAKTQWFHHPVLGTGTRCLPENCPEGYVPGRRKPNSASS